MKKTDERKLAKVGNMARDTETASRKEKLEIQRRVAYAAGLFQGDVTIRTLLESLAEAVVIIDPAANIVLVNSQVERLFGYRKEEIISRPLNTLIPERFHSAHETHVKGYFKCPRIRPMGEERDLVGRKKDGAEFPVEISLSHLDATGYGLAMAFVTDITLRKEAENDLKTRNEELDAFAHTVAHDLKGSLTSLIGYSEFLSQAGVDLEEQTIREALDEICTSGRKMADVIEELLLLARVRKEDVTVTSLDMRSIVSEAMLRLRHECEKYETEIVVAVNFPEALGYAPWVEEVWYNYIGNAIKYNGTPPKIEIGGELKNDGFVKFWVKDKGPGLSDAEQSCLFTPYALRKRKPGGHGLGLSIVKRIVEKLNGKVGVQSRVNEGSIFSFTLPSA